MNKQGFTLVELIVVITILAVLATIAFISFQGYTVSTRDTVRKADTKMIQKALDLEITKNNIVPYPSNYITLALDGEDFGYQGDAGLDVLGNLGIADEVLDPLDNTLYTYSTNLSRNQYQILGFLESPVALNVSKNVFANYEDRIALLRGDEIGIIFDESTQELIHLEGQDINITGNENKYGLYIESGASKISSGDEIIASLLDFRINPQGSCYNILKNGLSTGDGIYNIVNKNGDRVKVYCNMSQQGGGWTLIIKADGNNTTFQYSSNLWTNSNTLNPGDLSLDKNEFKSELFSNTRFNEVLLVLETNDIQKELVIDKYAGSLQDIFTSSYTVTSLGRDEWIDSVGSASMQPNCNQEGFNAFRVRLGLSSNNENNCGTNDSYLGIGLHSRTSNGRGYYSSVGNNCGSSLCSNGNKEINSFGYLYIR